jgi:hypothetical protein
MPLRLSNKISRQLRVPRVRDLLFILCIQAESHDVPTS